MAEIAAVPWSGLTAASTFSGCGGTCLGLRWAGFKVLWASEFIPSAAEVYRANHPGSILDINDIRKVEPEQILEATGLDRGDLDLLDGSPPCASFSLAGKREVHWGEVKTYSDTKQRVDDLFFEFARILEGLQPRAFVAENVKGLVIGKAKGYFKEILARLKSCGYRVRARVLDAQWLGVPQRRQRLIFVGIRDDLDADPVHPTPFPYRYTLVEACPWIKRVRCGDKRWRCVEEGSSKNPAQTVMTHARLNGYTEGSVIEEGSSIEGYAIEKEWEKLRPGESSDKYLNLVRAHPDRPSPTVTQLAGRNGGVAGVTHPFERRKFSIGELRRICGFPDDFVLTGTYAQRWERLGRAVPPPMSRQIGLAVRRVLEGVDG